MTASLAVVLAAYGAYAVAVVPLVEPQAAPTGGGSGAVLVGGEPLDPVTRQRNDLAYWFAEDDWERRSPKVLESPRGKLLVGSYENLGGGRVLLKPCTMIAFPSGEARSDEDRKRRALVLRAPEGAELVFDENFDLQKAQLGRLIGGKLLGTITIQSDQADPGPGDDLHIVCRELTMVDDRITSPHPVDFRLGQNTGHGRDLEIRLVNDPHPAAEAHQATPTIQGIRWFELKRDVRMRLVMAGQGLLPATEPEGPAAPAAAGEASSPVEVTCQGAFRCDLEQYVCTFRDAVDVIRLHPSGTSDQLLAELLSIHLAPVGVAPPPAGPGRMQKIPRLEADWIEALGHPVQVNSPSAAAQARGQHLKYQIRTRAVSLEDPHEAVVTRNGDEIRARQLSFTPAAGNPWGSFFAGGAGQMRGFVPQRREAGAATATSLPAGGNRQPFEARWTRGVRFQPHNGEHVLTIEGQAHVYAAELGGLDAEVIHTWFAEVLAPPEAEMAPQGGSRRPQHGPRTKLVPLCLLAQKNVRLISAALTGDVEALKVFFQHEDLVASPVPAGVLPPPDSAPARPVTPPVIPLGAAGASPLAPPSPVTRPGDPPPQRFHLEGELLQVELRVVGDQPQLARADVRRRVRVTETQTSQPDDQPLVITGDGLVLEQAAPGQIVATVLGQPGHVEGREMVLDGAKIVLDRVANRLRVEDGGRLLLPVNGDAAAGFAGAGAVPAPPPAGAAEQTLEVRWLGTLDFDGLLARFQRDVVARLDPQTLSTAILEVHFADRVNFGGPAGPPPRVEALVCRQRVVLDRVTRDPAGPLTDERLEVEELRLEQATGAIQARGPGVVHLVRRDDGSGPALPGRLPQFAPPQPPLAGSGEGPAPGLRYLGVQFREGIRGNFRQRELTFFNKVRAVYGPAQHWEARLPFDGDPADWGPQGMRMECDELTVVQLPGSDGQPATELIATGHADIEGSNFVALAERVAYAEAKRVLTLEGSGRADAMIAKQTVPGAPGADVKARKITYELDTGRWRVDDFRGGEFLQNRAPGPGN